MEKAIRWRQQVALSAPEEAEGARGAGATVATLRDPHWVVRVMMLELERQRRGSRWHLDPDRETLRP